LEGITEKDVQHLSTKSIQFKLVGVILTVIAVAITGLAIATYLSTRDVIVSNTDQQLRNDATELAEDVALWLDMKRGEVAAIAASPTVATGDKNEIMRYITAEVKRLDGYELLLVGDANGSYYTSNGQTANNSDRDYFKKVMATGEAYVSDPLVARTTRHNVIIVAAPILKEGKVIGVVGGSVRLESIEKKIQAVKRGKSGYAYLVQADGLVVAHPDPVFSMKKNLLADPDVDNRLKITFQGAAAGQTVVGRYASPALKTEQFVGFAPVAGTNNWVTGITVPVDDVWAPLYRLNFIFSVATLLILILTGVIIKWFLSNTIIQPLLQLKTLIEQVAKGDLTVRGKARADDELGQLTLSVNQTLDAICDMIGKIHFSTGELKTASAMLQAIARTVADNSATMNGRTLIAENAVREILTRIDTTNRATEETGNNITSIAAAVQEMAATASTVVMVAENVSSTVDSVRQAIEGVYVNTDRVSQSAGDMSVAVEQVVQSVQEINCSIGNVKTNCDRSVQITLNAKEFAQETSRVIAQLSDSSNKINKIVSIISNIASQTSMLALNATIEAASAGEAGKGFAVVAGEVKELAQRTARATDEIGQQLEEMQGNMSTAVQAVEKITQVIFEVTDITGIIGHAIAEQSEALEQITCSSVDAGNMVNFIAKEIMTVNVNCKLASQSAIDASQGVSEITQSITELSEVTNSIARNVEAVSVTMEAIVEAGQEIFTRSNEISISAGEVTEISQDTSAQSADTMKAADSLAETAASLDKLVKVFKIE
jgi:methyl-accepting chemotaxis protein